MPVIIYEETGDRFEVQDKWSSKTITHWISQTGLIWDTNGDGPGEGWLGLRLIRKQHTFGDVVYEETGEVQSPRGIDGNKWWIGGVNDSHATFGGSFDAHPILKPIGTISEDGKTLYRNDGTSEPVALVDQEGG